MANMCFCIGNLSHQMPIILTKWNSTDVSTHNVFIKHIYPPNVFYCECRSLDYLKGCAPAHDTYTLICINDYVNAEAFTKMKCDF